MQPQSDPVVENGLKVGSFDAETISIPVFEPMPEPEFVPPAPAPGEILREAREARGESVNDVARILKLSAHQLEALENGRFDVLPGPTFVRGFLRNYARYLDIPPEPLLEGINIRTPTAADLSSMLKLHGNVQPKASPRAHSKMLPVVLIILAVLIVLGVVGVAIYKGWFEFRFSLSTAAPVQKQVEQVVLPGPQKPVQPKLQPAAQFKVQTFELTAPVPINIAPDSAKDPTQMDVAQEGSGAPSVPDVATLRLLFNASTLAQVRDSSGKIIFTRTGTKGSSNSIKGKPPFSVTVNNANNVELEFNGQAVDLKEHTSKNGIARLTLQ